MTSRTDRLLVALGLALGTASTSLQAIGIAAEKYALTVQIVAVVCSVVGMFIQTITRPISEAFRKDPPA